MDNMCMAILFLLFGISSVVTGNTTAKRSRDISKYLLLKNYWSEKLSKADNGYLILTTKYKIPNNLNVSQHKPDELIQGGIVPVDCSAIHKHWPTAPNGVYKIYPAGGMGHTVYCDMKTDGGGWTIFQRRFDGSENFYRSWSDYRQGFGHVTGEHWLGNQILHEITVHGLYEMRIDLSDFDGNKKFAKYSTFSIANEAAGYRIQFSGYTGTAGTSDISKYVLLKNYWSEKLSKADNGYLILTTKNKIPYNLNVSKQKPDELIQGGIVPVDCSDIHKHWPTAPNGEYKIYPAGGMGHTVYCDMKTDGGGWTIFQRRFDGSEEFYRGWSDYKQGFGNVAKEHWLGNQILHEITVHGLYEMRIDLSDFAGNNRFAKYSTFSIANEAAGYRTQFSGYTGTAGDSMSMANGMKFTTYDKDLDRASYNCAESTNGAWWFNNCFRAHLNGKYHKTARTDDWRGLIWYTWHGKSYSLKQTSMMLRKHQKKETK